MCVCVCVCMCVCVPVSGLCVCVPVSGLCVCVPVYQDCLCACKNCVSCEAVIALSVCQNCVCESVCVCEKQSTKPHFIIRFLLLFNSIHCILTALLK